MLTILLCLAIGDFGGDVVEICDGDTFWMIDDDGYREKIRLHGVDAPERRQPHGYESTVSLATLCLWKRVSVIERGRDRNGRIVAVVLCEGVEINTEQVCLGHCWVDPRYNRSKVLERYQESAKLLHRGLWAKSDPVEPWRWRKSRIHPSQTKLP